MVGSVHQMSESRFRFAGGMFVRYSVISARCLQTETKHPHLGESPSTMVVCAFFCSAGKAA